MSSGELFSNMFQPICRTCLQCGAEFQTTSRMAKRCPACRRTRAREKPRGLARARSAFDRLLKKIP
jgi:DNA-directed RNA polymerase subunit RPC12/RpoP